MTAASTAAPEGSRLRGTASRRRNEGVIRMVLLAAAVVSILISVGIVLSLVFEAIAFIAQIDLSQLFAAGWFPRRGQFSIGTIVAGTLIITIVAISLAAPVGPGQCDLPVRVREQTGSRHRQADPGDPRRHPQRRPRLLRPELDQPERGPGDLHRCQGLQPAVGRARGRDPDHPARGIHLRGLDAGGPHRSSRGVVRPRRPQAPDVRPRRRPGGDLRASSRR